VIISVCLRMEATGESHPLESFVQRHDGQAVVCEDFWQAMADANVDQPAYSDLPALWAWYDQSGTPRLSVRTAYDKSAQTFTVHARQVTPGTADQPSENKVSCIGVFIARCGASADIQLKRWGFYVRRSLSLFP